MPRLQFTMTGVLLATFWIAVFFGVWAAAARANEDLGFYMLPMGYTLIVSPFLAAGALFGRAREAALIFLLGLAVMAAILALAWCSHHLYLLFA
jgi:hypothetical protein